MNKYSDEASFNLESLFYLFQNCRNLERVILGAAYGLYRFDNEHVEPLLQCKKMKQLDVSRCDVSWELVNQMFTSWPELRLLDLCDCKKITKTHVRQWRQLYPRVSIKFNSELHHVCTLDDWFDLPSCSRIFVTCWLQCYKKKPKVLSDEICCRV